MIIVKHCNWISERTKFIRKIAATVHTDEQNSLQLLLIARVKLPKD